MAKLNKSLLLFSFLFIFNPISAFNNFSKNVFTKFPINFPKIDFPSIPWLQGSKKDVQGKNYIKNGDFGEALIWGKLPYSKKDQVKDWSIYKKNEELSDPMIKKINNPSLTYVNKNSLLIKTSTNGIGIQQNISSNLELPAFLHANVLIISGKVRLAVTDEKGNEIGFNEAFCTLERCQATQDSWQSVSIKIEDKYKPKTIFIYSAQPGSEWYVTNVNLKELKISVDDRKIINESLIPVEFEECMKLNSEAYENCLIKKTGLPPDQWNSFGVDKITPNKNNNENNVLGESTEVEVKKIYFDVSLNDEERQSFLNNASSWNQEGVNKTIHFENAEIMSFDPAIESRCSRTLRGGTYYFPDEACRTFNNLTYIFLKELLGGMVEISRNVVLISGVYEANYVAKHETGHLLGSPDTDFVEIRGNNFFPEGNSKRNSFYDDVMYSVRTDVRSYSREIIKVFPGTWYLPGSYAILKELTFWMYQPQSFLLVDESSGKQIRSGEYNLFLGRVGPSHVPGTISDFPNDSGFFQERLLPPLGRAMLNYPFVAGFILVRSGSDGKFYRGKFDLIDLTMAKLNGNDEYTVSMKITDDFDPEDFYHQKITGGLEIRKNLTYPKFGYINLDFTNIDNPNKKYSSKSYAVIDRPTINFDYSVFLPAGKYEVSLNLFKEEDDFRINNKMASFKYGGIINVKYPDSTQFNFDFELQSSSLYGELTLQQNGGVLFNKASLILFSPSKQRDIGRMDLDITQNDNDISWDYSFDFPDAEGLHLYVLLALSDGKFARFDYPSDINLGRGEKKNLDFVLDLRSVPTPIPTPTLTTTLTPTPAPFTGVRGSINILRNTNFDFNLFEVTLENLGIEGRKHYRSATYTLEDKDSVSVNYLVSAIPGNFTLYPGFRKEIPGQTPVFLPPTNYSFPINLAQDEIKTFNFELDLRTNCEFSGSRNQCIDSQTYCEEILGGFINRQLSCGAGLLCCDRTPNLPVVHGRIILIWNENIKSGFLQLQGGGKIYKSEKNGETGGIPGSTQINYSINNVIPGKYQPIYVYEKSDGLPRPYWMNLIEVTQANDQEINFTVDLRSITPTSTPIPIPPHQCCWPLFQTCNGTDYGFGAYGCPMYQKACTSCGQIPTPIPTSTPTSVPFCQYPNYCTTNCDSSFDFSKWCPNSEENCCRPVERPTPTPTRRYIPPTNTPIPPTPTPSPLPQFGQCGSCGYPNDPKYGGCARPGQCREVNDAAVCATISKTPPCCVWDSINCGLDRPISCAYQDSRVRCNKCESFNDGGSPSWCLWNPACGNSSPKAPRLKIPNGTILSYSSASTEVTLNWFAYQEGGGNPDDCEANPAQGDAQYNCWGYVCARGSFDVYPGERHYSVFVKEPNESDFKQICTVDNIPNISQQGGGMYDKTKCSFRPSGTSGTYQWKVRAYYVIARAGESPFVNSSDSAVGTFTLSNFNLTYLCNSQANRATLSWNTFFGITGYALRVNYIGDTWDGSCQSIGGDFCDNNVTGTSYSFNVLPGKRFSWWIHAKYPNGVWGEPMFGREFACNLPTVTPTNIPIPTATRIPTQIPTPTPTPTSTPVSCNHTCDVSVGPYCTSGLVCNIVFWDTGLCRNPSCRESQNCLCPTPTLTPRPTNTPTPRPAVYGCNGVCQRNSDCQTGYCKIIISGIIPGICRNQNCPTLSDTNCICPSITPTRIPTLLPTGIPTAIPTVIPTSTARPTNTPTFILPTNTPVPIPAIMICDPTCFFGPDQCSSRNSPKTGYSCMRADSKCASSGCNSSTGSWCYAFCTTSVMASPIPIPTIVTATTVPSITPAIITTVIPIMIPRQCEYCRVYDSSWNQLVQAPRKGQSIYFSTKEVRNNPVYSMKARFRINNSADASWCNKPGLTLVSNWCETTLNRTDEWYIPYTINQAGRLTVGSMLFNTDTGWY